ncbi:MAG: TonB-dependent receptor [Muribaculaceae bacterium]|nr:TonB-dependent receptor [Muribaculaceae bacterium]
MCLLALTSGFPAAAAEAGGLASQARRTIDASADSVAEQLREVVVTTQRRPRDIIPVQTLSGKELRSYGGTNVADALRYFSGVQVKDYGGVGGIKTVNIRSMGTNHTGVVYDGVELGNAQNGQIDLGQFSLDNIESLSLYNGQKSDILQPAKDFGSAGTIYMRTRRPSFVHDERYHVRGTFRTGSFDLINPSALVEVNLGRGISASASAEWVKSSGRYRFRYRRFAGDGNVAYDTSAVRENGDINALRTELNVYGTLKRGSWSAKVYRYQSERGIPGAIVNNVWRRGERVWDTNTFGQARYTGYFGRFTTLANVKYANYHTHYVNNDDRQVAIDNRYRQQEFYLSTANQYEVCSHWSASLCYDMLWNTMTADLYNFARPTRFSHYVALASSVDFERVRAQASVLGTFIHDSREGSRASASRQVLTPAVFVNAYPLNDRCFSLRAFFKQSYRMPTFNDLYYADMGNSALSPERVSQYNIGVVYERQPHGFVDSWQVTADAYYNYVKDKIVAYPKGQQFRWTMLNLGKVDIRGVDLAAVVTIRPVGDLTVTLRGQYTFQRAIDVTNPSDSYYHDQIPYVPRHSGSAVGGLQWRGWGLNYSWIYVGERYNQQENISYNYMQPWRTSDVSVSKDLQIKRVSLRARLEVNNLFNQDYDVILNYPMPRRNYRFSISFEL